MQKWNEVLLEVFSTCPLRLKLFYMEFQWMNWAIFRCTFTDLSLALMYGIKKYERLHMRTKIPAAMIMYYQLAVRTSEAVQVGLWAFPFITVLFIIFIVPWSGQYIYNMWTALRLTGSSAVHHYPQVSFREDGRCLEKVRFSITSY